jgi:hypothetical protein
MYPPGVFLKETEYIDKLQNFSPSEVLIKKIKMISRKILVMMITIVFI